MTATDAAGLPPRNGMYYTWGEQAGRDTAFGNNNNNSGPGGGAALVLLGLALAAIVAIVECGGDTDSTAAILGGIVGASCGAAGIPADWQSGLLEWPRSIGWMTRLGGALGRAQAQAPVAGVKQRVPELFFPAVLARNVFFLGVVLFHGFRRLLPPY